MTCHTYVRNAYSIPVGQASINGELYPKPDYSCVCEVIHRLNHKIPGAGCFDAPFLHPKYETALQIFNTSSAVFKVRIDEYRLRTATVINERDRRLRLLTWITSTNIEHKSLLLLLLHTNLPPALVRRVHYHLFASDSKMV